MRYELFNDDLVGSIGADLRPARGIAMESIQTSSVSVGIGSSTSSKALSPEVMLLLAAASPCRSKDFLRAQFRILPPTDWSVFEEIAYSQQLMLLAESKLRALPSLSPLKKILCGARAKYFSTLRKSLFVDNLTVQVALLLSSAGLPVLLFKGTPFLRQIYGDMGLQETNDVDVMVRREHVGQAIEILQALGFRETSVPAKSHNTACQQLHRRIGGWDYRIIVHWNFPLTHSVRVPIEEVWQSAIPYTESAAADLNWVECDQRLMRPNVFAFSPEFQWLFVLLELAEGQFNRWLDFADLCQITLTYKSLLDWHRMANRLEDFKMKRIAYRALVVADAWGLEVPEAFIESVRPAFLRVLRHWSGQSQSLTLPHRRVSPSWQNHSSWSFLQPASGANPWRAMRSLMRSTHTSLLKHAL